MTHISSHMETQDKMQYGNQQVPVSRKDWHPPKPNPCFKRIYDLNVGISWCEVATSKQFEWYVQDDKTIVPVGAMMAHQLKTQGAQSVVFINLMSRLVLVNERLTCVGRWNGDGLVVTPGYEDIRNMICCVNKTVGKLSGLPNVIALCPQAANGTIKMRKALRAGAGRLSVNDHDMANRLREIYGTQLDLAVVKWGGIADWESAA